MKKVLILGSTGSIGVNTLEVIKANPDKFKVFGLTANSNIDMLEKQVKEFNPEVVYIKNEGKYLELKGRLDKDCKLLTGQKGLLDISSAGDYDILISALVGFAGLAPTIEAIKKNKRIALANKETLVAAGELVIDLCKKYNTEIIPVDSEHSAIFQCLVGEESKNIKKLILTASGGPFFNKTEEELNDVSIEQALNHPNWKMGNKITIDSATMMNKGLEVIEAHWLFNLPKDRIDVVVHPQSIIHSMVEFIDGSIKAQLSMPDMKLPIQYALSYPERIAGNYVETNFLKIGELTFREPDLQKFQCLKLAYSAMEEAGTAPCILNAANEVAVSKFLNGKIKFKQIPEYINKALNKIENHRAIDMETIVESDRQTREYVNNL